MKTIGKYLVALVLSVLVAPAIANDRLSAQDILSRVANEGGHAVLWDLWAHEAQFGQVLDGIQSGDAAWLEVAGALRPYSDAGASLSLDYSAARALPAAPEKVLRLVGKGFKLDNLCTSPFIEPEPGVAEAYEREALAALAKVKVQALAEIVTECSQKIRLPPAT